MDKNSFLAGAEISNFVSPVSQIINDFENIPADTDLRELIFVSYPENAEFFNSENN